MNVSTLKMPSTDLRRSLERAAESYATQLPGSPVATYLESRGIGPGDAARFRLGYVGTPEKGHEQYAKRLAIPYLTKAGVVGFRFRGDRGSKYLGLRGLPTYPWNVAALENQTVYITEGELDALTMEICGFPAVGIPGATNWKSLYKRIFRYHKTYFLPDAGDAGEKLLNIILEDLPSTGIIRVPDQMDVNEYYVQHGADGIGKLVRG